MAPLDAHNQRLLASVHPEGWKNPAPAPRYNMAVIGAGTAGLVIAAGAAGLGAKVALIERALMGGDCLNFGCVPSKALISASRVAASARRAGDHGVRIGGDISVDFGAVMERMRQLRADLAANDSAARFTALGVDVFIGDARFTAPDAIEVAGATIRFSRAAIATGARAVAPPIEGLADAGYLTNETVFSMTEMPRRLAVIGAGPLGCELAQAMCRLGAEVTLLEVMPQILIREDRDAAIRIAAAMRRDGMRIITGCTIARVEKRGAEKILDLAHGGGQERIAADEILIGAGRAPAVDRLGLEAAGVEYGANGVRVNDYLQTTNPRIYAAGDVASPYKFTHVADAAARAVIRNALFFGRARASALTIPWCTYTDPEIAHVGMYAEEAEKRGIKVDSFTQEFSTVDRAVLDGETDGFARMMVKKGTDTIVGATIVASHAGEMISEITTAMEAGVGLGKLAFVIHPYPTQAEALRKIGDAYNRTRLTSRMHRILQRYFGWRR